MADSSVKAAALYHVVRCGYRRSVNDLFSRVGQKVFLPKKVTITGVYYADLLHKLRLAIKEKR